MALFWRMGWRNIWRNKRRSAITIGALAFSITLLVVFIGILAYWMKNMEESIVGLTLGDLQVHHPLYLSDQNLFEVIEDVEPLLAKLTAAGFAASPRAYGYGLLADDRTTKSAGVWIKGIDLEREKAVTTLHQERNLLAGRYLSGRTRNLDLAAEEKEEEPEEEEPELFDPLGGDDEPQLGPATLRVGEVVLGKKLAKSIGAEPGDTVAVVTMTADGSIGNEVFDVVGVFENFSEAEDRSLVLMSLEDYRRLFHFPAGRVHEVAMRRPEGTDLATAKKEAEAIVGDAGETQTWKEIQPAQAEILGLQNSVSLVFSLVMYAGAGLLIMNSMLMMVFERIHEFGVMKAVGLRGKQLIGLVYFETFWLCIVAAAIGTALAVPITIWIGRVGIDLSVFAPDGFAFSGMVLDPVMYATLTPSSFLVPLGALFGIAFVSVFYPAVKAAAIEPVEAIYHV